MYQFQPDEIVKAIKKSDKGKVIFWDDVPPFSVANVFVNELAKSFMSLTGEICYVSKDEECYKVEMISETNKEGEISELLDFLSFEYNIFPRYPKAVGLIHVNIKVPFKIARAMVKLI